MAIGLLESPSIGEADPPSPLPSRPTGPPASSAWLAEVYRTTLRLFWQLERSKRALRRDGELLSVVQLAEAISVARRTIYAHAAWFLQHLPDEEVATDRVKTWREVFLPLGADLLAKGEEMRARAGRRNPAQRAPT